MVGDQKKKFAEDAMEYLCPRNVCRIENRSDIGRPMSVVPTPVTVIVVDKAVFSGESALSVVMPVTVIVVVNSFEGTGAHVRHFFRSLLVFALFPSIFGGTLREAQF